MFCNFFQGFGPQKLKYVYPQVVEVSAVGFVYAGQSNKLFSFGSNGLVFTADHQFFVKFDGEETAAQSMSALIASDPEQALSTTIKEFKDVETLLKLDGILSNFITDKSTDVHNNMDQPHSINMN